MKDKSSLPEYLHNTYAMLVNAFPNGMEEGNYFPLIAILYEGMSHRSLAEVVSAITETSYSEVLNDVYKVGSQKDIEGHVEVTLDELERVKRLLLPYGYDKWLEENSW
jgi:hypothetical protein